MMKKDDRLRELYIKSFDKVHASDALLRKVETMSNENVKGKKIIVLRRALCVAAAVVVLFVLSNVVALAATGETWVEHIFVRAVINGEEQALDVVKTTDENGNTSYEVTIEDDIEDDENNQSLSFTLDGDEIKDGDTVEMQFVGADVKLTEEDGRIYLDWESCDLHEDITDDFADGKASLTVKDDSGASFTLNVEGTLDSYSVSLSE